MPQITTTLIPPKLPGAPGSPTTGQMYYDTGTNILYWYNGTAWIPAQGGGGGSASANTVTITQAAHGFTVGNILYFNGTTYVKAQADNAVHAEVVGLVSAVIDSGHFTLLTDGYITGLSGLTAGSAHFLSPTVAGGLTVTEPSAAGQISKPILIADSTTSGYLQNFRGQVKGTGGTGGSAFVPLSAVGVASGVASLDGTGKVPVAQLPTSGGGITIATALPGSPTDGQTVGLKVGSGAPYTYVYVTYDATAGKWFTDILAEFSPVVEQQVSAYNVSVPTLSGTPKGPMITWKDFSLLGLIPYIRYSANVQQEFTVGLTQIAYYGVTLGGGNGALTAISGTQITAGTANGATSRYMRSPWTPITDPASDQLLFAIQCWVQSNTYHCYATYTGIELRYGT